MNIILITVLHLSENKIVTKGAFTPEAKQSELWQPSQVATSHARNMPNIQKQFCLSEVKQPLAKFATCCNLSQVVDDVKLWLLSADLRPVYTHLKVVSNFGPFVSVSKKIL